LENTGISYVSQNTVLLSENPSFCVSVGKGRIE